MFFGAGKWRESFHLRKDGGNHFHMQLRITIPTNKVGDRYKWSYGPHINGLRNG